MIEFVSTQRYVPVEHQFGKGAGTMVVGRCSKPQVVCKNWTSLSEQRR